jgi:L-ascorbate metabolism protein UlaG (beta-lactamase superfamily)
MLDGFEVPLFLNREKGEFMLCLRDGVFPDRHKAILELSVAHMTAKLQKEENMDLKEAVKKIHWLGHDAIRLDGSTVVLIDPFQILDTKPADLILISHEHFDHNSPDDLVKIQKSDSVIVTDSASAKKLKDDKRIRGEIKVAAPGDRLTVKGVEIEVGPAYNTNKEFHPKAAGMLSFIIKLDGVRYYHAGDTDFIPEMNKLSVDIAFLPVSGTYVMTADEAVQAAKAINPKIAVPMHYGAIVGSEDDAKKFKKALEGQVEVVILKKETA